MMDAKKRRPGGGTPGRQTNKGKITPSSAYSQADCNISMSRGQGKNTKAARLSRYEAEKKRLALAGLPHLVYEHEVKLLARRLRV